MWDFRTEQGTIKKNPHSQGLGGFIGGHTLTLTI